MSSRVDLVVYEPTQRRVRRLVRSLRPEELPAWSPDSSRIAYWRAPAVRIKRGADSTRVYQVWTVRTDGSQKHKVWPPDGAPAPAWWSEPW